MARSTTTEVDVRIGATIKAFRVAAHMTQVELATAVGVTFQQIQKYERGLNRVSAAAMLKLAQTFDCSVLSLYGETELSANTHSERVMLKLWSQLSGPERDAVVAMIREFAKREARPE